MKKEKEQSLRDFIDDFPYSDEQKEQKPAEKQDYSGLTDLERAIHRGFLSAGVENVPVIIIKETAQECLAQMKPAEWGDEDEEMLDAMIDIISNSLYEPLCPREGMFAWLLSLRPKSQGVYKTAIESIFKMCESYEKKGIFTDERAIDFLGNVRVKCKDAIECAPILDVPSWKPSEELLGCLERLIAFKNPEPEDIKGCESLYEQLKKL